MNPNRPNQNHSSPKKPSPKPSFSMWDRGIVFPTLIMTISLVVLILIRQFEQPHYQDASVNAQFFPSVIALAQIIICFALMVQHIRKTKADSPALPLFSRMAVFGMGFLMIYVLMISLLGYLSASVMAFTAYLVCQKSKNPFHYAFAWTFVFVVYYLFGEVFFIALPQGLYY